MKYRNKILLSGLAVSMAMAFSACQPSSSGSADEGKVTKIESYYQLNAEGALIRPVNYRTWVFVGTPVTPNDMNNGKAAFPEFHNVYIDPVSYEHYKDTGEWREGTILMKELVSVGTKAASSGNGYFMGDFIGLEATIKSAKDFPNEPGNWAYFSFTNPETGVLAETGTAFAAESCNACHEGTAQDDFVFTQHYPVLSAAKGYGAGIPENTARRTPVKKPRSAVANVESMENANDPWKATALTPDVSTSDVPVKLDPLFAYLNSGDYRNFKHQESENHPSAGPHTQLGLPVRVYYNDQIAASLLAGQDEHPKGSAIVKEMFDADNVLSGWAVMVKTHDATDGGNGWFWYEGISVTDKTEMAAIGNGVPGCQSCHTIGTDMVRSNFAATR